MSQVDNRNSSAAKRARTDGGRREDDWTCPSCGNVNFSFRTTCNMRSCTQSRPADHNSKAAQKGMQGQHSYNPPAYGSGAPSSMYMMSVQSPYGSSLFHRATSYDAPPPPSLYSGSPYHYNYSTRISQPTPYRPMHLSAPSPYSPGSFTGNGAMYGAPPIVDRYGLHLPMGHATVGPRPGFFPDDKPPRKGPEGTRDNDWTCPTCGNVNFSFRTVCNMRKCNTAKPEAQAANSGKSSKPEMREGNWKCEKCNNINYSFRTKCNRQNCGAEKPSEESKNNNSPPKTEAADENEQ